MPGTGLEPVTRGFSVLIKSTLGKGFRLYSEKFPQDSPNLQKFRSFGSRSGLFGPELDPQQNKTSQSQNNEA
jgi:hypothetical protein